MFRITGRIARLAVLAALVVLAAGGQPARAQDGLRDWNKQRDSLQGALGLHYGKLGGHGLAFRYPLQWYLYLQMAGGIWHSTDDKRHNAGLELQYILRQDQRLRLFVATGLGFFYHKEKTAVTAGVEHWARHENWNSGLGVGVEYLQGERWSFQLEVDFVHESDDGEIKLAPQAGIYYYW